MTRQTKQQLRDEEEYKKKLNAQIGFYRPTCVLGGGAYHGMCSGPLQVYSRQGHGLCQRHQQVVRSKGRVGICGTEVFIEAVHG